MKTPSHLIALSFALTAAPLWAVPVELARESFEGAAGAIGFTTSTAQFDEPSVATSDFFSVIPNNGTRLTGGIISGGDGPNMFAAEDIDTAPGLLAPTQSLTTNAFNIAGKSNLSVRILLAAPGTGPATGGVQTFYDHSNTASEIDFVKVEASVDGGPFAPLIQFSPTTAAPAVNATLSLDTDFNGLGGQGTVLTAAFQDFTLPIATGSSVRVRVSMHSNATNEYICLDNLRIFGESSTTAAPVLGGVPGTILAFTEGGAAAAVAPALTVTDPDSTNLTGATVTLSQNYTNGEDVLAATASGGLTVAFTPSSGVLTISGTASKAVYQTVLQSVTYRNTNLSAPNTDPRLIRFSTTDGVNASNQPVREVSITDNLITQPLPFTESFETDGRGSRYALDGRFTSSAVSYFDRQPTVPSVTNLDGTAALVGEDTETNAAPLKAVRFQLNTSGLVNNQAVVRLGAPAGAVFDTGDLLAVEASADGGAWTPAGIFRSTGGGSTPLALDTNGDGVGDGTTLLTTALQDFTFPLPVATTLGLRIRLVSNSTTEQMVVDKIVVSGTLAPVSNTNDSGPGSLRNTLAAASPGASILFDPGLSGKKITLAGTALVIDKALTLDATTLAGGLILQANGNSSVLRVTGAGNATLKGLTLQNGGGVSSGGGLYVSGTVNAVDCLFRYSTANNGGGVYVDTGGNATFTNCTIAGNQAFFNGGGLTHAGAVLTLTQCSIADNFAAGDAGGLHLKTAGAILSACTVADNRADSGKGGGMLVEQNISLTDSITGNNTAATTGPDIHRLAGVITVSGKNLIGNLSDSSLTTGASIIAGAPKLSPLAYYGGRTPTLHPLAGSPAIDAGAGGSLSTDQRGFPRLAGPPRDIGAVETGAVTLVTTNVDENGGSAAVSLREAIAAAPAQGGIIRFDPAVFNNATATTNTILEADAAGLRTLAVTGKSLFVDASNLTKGVTISGFNHTVACLTVDSTSTLTLHSMKVQRNSAAGTDSLIFNNGALNLIHSLLTGHNGFSNAHAVQSEGLSGTAGARMVVRNSTISGNLGNSGSASIFANGLNARSELILDHTTVTANVNQNGSALTNFSADVYLKNSLISGNTRTVGGSNADYQRSGGAVSLLGRVILGLNDEALTGIPGTNFRLIIAPPGLSPLGDFGGLTLCHYPLPGSAALNAATESTRTIDQRGLLRVAQPDVGSVEASVNTAPVISDIANQNLLEDAATGSLACTLGDIETAPAALTLSASSDNITLVPVASIVFGGSGASRTVSVTPAANQNGSATITVTVSDGTATTSDTFLLSVTVVNDAPSFTKGADLTVANSAGAQTLTAWATALSAGPADEATQTLSFSVTNSNNALFTAQPAIAANGTLTFTPAAAALGTALVSVRILDSGGTLNGGIAQSAVQTFNISLTPPPSLVVTTTADSGAGSLRQALANAAAIAGPDTVTFAPGLSTIILSSEIVITDPAGVTLNASSFPTGIVIDGGPGTNRLLRIDPGTSVTLLRLKLTGGNGVGGGAPPNYGGAIYNQGTLTLRECTLIDNNSTNAAGAIYNQDGTLTIERCTFSGNAAGSGGAILQESLQTMTVTASTFANNIGRFEGGAITVGNFRPANLIHCTIAGNAVTTAGGAGAGGVRGGTPGTHLIVRDCIISGNTDINTPGIPNLTPAPGSTTEGTNVIGPAALLAPLGDYGGPTQTMALRPGSPARNAATTSTATSDQRGFPIVGARDIGAYEAGNSLFTLYNTYIQETLPATATDPQHAAAFDFDGDGMNNQDEFLFGTAAESAASLFRSLITKDGGNIVINFPAISGRTYTLQRSDTLAPGSWAPTGLNFSGNGTAGFRLPTTTPARRYFRVEVSR